MWVPKSVADRSINLGKASEVKNCLGQGMESFEGKVAMSNGVVAYVYKGNYYLTPDGFKAMMKLQKADFEESDFMVLCSADPQSNAPKGFEVEWKKLRSTR